MTMGPQLVRTALGVLRHPTATRGELKAFQDSLLRRLVVHAYESVPYYRKLFDRHRLHPRHFRYRLGYIATRGNESCTCGQPFSTIKSIQGWMADYLPLPAAVTA